MATRTNVPDNGFVKSNSVTSQFNALSTDRERFCTAKAAADGDYQQVQANQLVLLTRIRSDQEALGDLTRKHDMLQTEKTRLTRVMDRERKALEDCASHTKTLSKQEKESTFEYAEKMGEISNDVASILHRHMDLKTASLLSADSIEKVVVPKIPADEPSKEVIIESYHKLRGCEQRLRRAFGFLQGLQSKMETTTGADPLNSEGNNESMADDPSSSNDTKRRLALFYGSDEEMEAC